MSMKKVGQLAVNYRYFSTCTEESKTPIYSVRESCRFMKDCLQAAGAHEGHAAQHADVLIAADYRGIFSHGMNRLEMYVEDLLNGRCNGIINPKIIKDSPAVAWVDGLNTFGSVVGNFCMSLAICKAKNVGIGFVSAKGSNHYGIAGYYASQAIKENVMGFSATNSSPLMAPTRAKLAALGTNPFSCAAPASFDSFILDMATTAVAVGKLEILKRKNEPIPVGWAQTNTGEPLTDSSSTEPRILLPLGSTEKMSSFKGYGLAAMIDILCGVLAGAHFGKNIRSWTNPVGDANLGQFFMAIDPAFFAPDFHLRLADFLFMLRSLDPINPDKPVLCPGDPEKKYMAKVDHDGGIRYLPNQIETCAKLAEKLSVKPMAPYQF